MPKIPSVTPLLDAHASRPYPKPPTVLALAQTGFGQETPSVSPLALQDARLSVMGDIHPHPYQKAKNRRRTLFTRFFNAYRRGDSPSNAKPTNEGTTTATTTTIAEDVGVASLLNVPPPPRPILSPSEVTTIKIAYPGKSSGRDQLKKRLKLGELTEDICNYIQELAKSHLDLSVSYELQTEDALDTVRAKATTKYPQLLNYADIWPLKDLLILDCKAGVQRAKARETRANANQRSASVRPSGRPASKRLTLAGGRSSQ